MIKKKKFFEDHILTRYHLYSNLLLSLPFERVYDDGVLLSLFTKHLQKCFENGLSSIEIVETFFENDPRFQKENFSETKKLSIFFRFVQFIERQITLFDAVEESAFLSFVKEEKKNDISSLVSFLSINKQFSLRDYDAVLKDYGLRVVLTAHPTQFYPTPVLDIIEDLRFAISNDDVVSINDLLKQLGKTPFFFRKRPTPLDEAESLIVFLKNVFYHSVPKLQLKIEKSLKEFKDAKNAKRLLFIVGFWPGGDRDGNPFVTADVTVEVAEALRRALFDCYLADLAKIIRRFTFADLYFNFNKIKKKLSATVENVEACYENSQQFLEDLYENKKILKEKHGSLFMEKLDLFIKKVECFQFHFASIDLRQDSRVHHQVVLEILDLLYKDGDKIAAYEALDDVARVDFLLDAIKVAQEKSNEIIEQLAQKDNFSYECIKTIFKTKIIRQKNGNSSIYRYIISNTRSASSIVELFFLFVVAGYPFEDIPFDIIPLFETMEDLQNCEKIMNFLYQCDWYRRYIKNRSSCQIIMLGFSDGTKDGGYFACNWVIFKAKEVLSMITHRAGFRVVFFDGRGGPPARGGGNTRRFYTSLSKKVKNEQIQLTIQGQTVSSNFFSVQKACHNMEQFFTAGIENKLHLHDVELSEEDRKIFDIMMDVSLKKYSQLKENTAFLSYLFTTSPLLYYSETNVASRPAARSSKEKFSLEDLRAIPFVTAWLMLKQLVPAFYGFGTALLHIKEKYHHFDLIDFYNRSPFFQAVVENSMQSLFKNDFELTKHHQKNEKFVKIWQDIKLESDLTNEMILYVSQKKFLENESFTLLSIKARENIVRPLIVLQQYALYVINEMNEKKRPDCNRKAYEKLVVRTLPGVVNAARNST